MIIKICGDMLLIVVTACICTIVVFSTIGFIYGAFNKNRDKFFS